MEQDKVFRIIFLCTDNVGRSIIAEYCTRDYLIKHNISNIAVSSAGTNASSDTTGFSMAHFPEMLRFGIDASGYTRTQFTKEMIDKSDLIVCMSRNHQDWLKKNFDFEAPLYNEIACLEARSIEVSTPGEDTDLDKRMTEITDYIYESTPQFVHNIKKMVEIKNG